MSPSVHIRLVRVRRRSQAIIIRQQECQRHRPGTACLPSSWWTRALVRSSPKTRAWSQTIGIWIENGAQDDAAALSDAKRMLEAGEAKAASIGIAYNIAVVDAGGARRQRRSESPLKAPV